MAPGKGWAPSLACAALGEPFASCCVVHELRLEKFFVAITLAIAFPRRQVAPTSALRIKNYAVYIAS